MIQDGMNDLFETRQHRDWAVRILTPDDAAALLQLKLDLDQETMFMMLEPGVVTDQECEVVIHDCLGRVPPPGTRIDPTRQREPQARHRAIPT